MTTWARALAYLRLSAVACLMLLGGARAAAAQEAHLLVITGVSGDDEHAAEFHKLATRFIDAAKKQDSVPDDHITYLAEKPDGDPQRIAGRSTKARITAAFADIAARAHPNDQIFVLLIGHGSFDGRVGAFNLPGPDLTAPEYATLLAKWPTQRVAFVDTSSASGAFLPEVAGPSRTIVTATRTGGEKNETRFPAYFVEAYENNAADADRNGRVSVLEAFDYAKAKVVKAFEQEGILLTEHATLDDGNEGKLAATLFLTTGAPSADAGLDLTNPEVRQLVHDRDALEQQIAALKLRKADMDAAAYAQELEKLLLALAEKTQALQRLQGKKEP